MEKKSSFKPKLVMNSKANSSQDLSKVTSNKTTPQNLESRLKIEANGSYFPPEKKRNRRRRKSVNNEVRSIKLG